jgi:hypothetical protein
VIGHKFITGLLKSILAGKNDTGGVLPASISKYAPTISGAVAAAAGVYLVTRTVKDAETRQLLAGGMVASFLHTVVMNLLQRNMPTVAAHLDGLGSSQDAYAARLSAMYGVGASIEPMYKQISGTGEYFGSGVGEYFGSGLGALPSYEAAAGMGEYFGSGLGEYGSNPDMMQAAAGYGAIDAGSNSNHLDPSSDLDRELSIAEAAAGVGSMMQAAAGLGNVVGLQSAQTWIPGETNASIWAGTRSVERSQSQTAMIPAGSLQSGGGQGVFG